MKHLVRAPSNIALIKYMGKSDLAANLPENASLSMTLESLATWVSTEPGPNGAGLVLLPGVPQGAPASARAPSLSVVGIEKALKHCERVREEAKKILPAHGLKYSGAPDLALRTGNTFPEASGIASSASSFAALTLAVTLASAADAQAFGSVFDGEPALRRDLARLSRLGSGSSCRSFEGPWVLWDQEDAIALSAPLIPELTHFVLVISADSKTVSSSEAHARVKTSPLWAGRTERVGRRLALVRTALDQADMPALARLAWSEAWEMHSLFHTSAEPFSYWKPGTIDALHWLAPFVRANHPPIVTLDAGPNIHITVRSEDAPAWRARLSERFGAILSSSGILEDRPGRGAEILS